MLQNERRNFKGRWSSYDRSSDIMRHEAILDLCCHFTPKYFFTQAYMDALIVSFAFIQEKHIWTVGLRSRWWCLDELCQERLFAQPA